MAGIKNWAAKFVIFWIIPLKSSQDLKTPDDDDLLVYVGI